MKNYRYTPETIDSLKDNEVFVFGTSVNGIHKTVQAKKAFDCFHAHWGIEEGHTGNCYAIPMFYDDMLPVSDMELYESLIAFLHYVEENPSLTFYFSKIGCYDTDSWKISSIVDLFWDAVSYVKKHSKSMSILPNNLFVPIEFNPNYSCIKDLNNQIDVSKTRIKYFKDLNTNIRNENIAEMCQNQILDLESNINDLEDILDNYMKF